MLQTPSKAPSRWERLALADRGGSIGNGGTSPLSARKTPHRTPGQGDRFIPARAAMDMEVARFNLLADAKENAGGAATTGGAGAVAAAVGGGAAEYVTPGKEHYKLHLADNLLREPGTACGNGGGGVSQRPTKILAFKHKAPAPPEGYDGSRARVLYSQSGAAGARAPPRRAFRHIPQAPERILDAPELVDDYYLNLLDWGSRNTVAVALGGAVYLWDAASGFIEELSRCAGESDYVTSVAWAADGRHLAVGLSTSEVQLWDSCSLRQIRTLKGHTARVSSLSWNGSTLSTGGRDNLIINHDGVESLLHRLSLLPSFKNTASELAERRPLPYEQQRGSQVALLTVVSAWWRAVRVREHVTAQLAGHAQEVCGLRWSPSGQQLASGGNDNLLLVWDSAAGGSGGPLHRLDAHQAAVKALAWCPFQANLLASGGGTADRCIKFWNTHTGALVNSVDTNSQPTPAWHLTVGLRRAQVCSLLWSQHEREILSSHGFSQNQLCLWRYPSMTKAAELTGHTARVLHLAQSPDGLTVLSAAADETLRFWKVFGPQVEAGGARAGRAKAAGEEKKSVLLRANIR
eukprot:SM000079S22420  [mRNA]  locus=s79:111299:113567:+ [translate_table: standard]